MAGFFEEPAADYQRRYARGLRRLIEASQPKPYEGSRLYPSGGPLWQLPDSSFKFHYSFTYELDCNKLREKIDARFKERSLEWYRAHRAMGEMHSLSLTGIPSKFHLGGNGWTHAVMDYQGMLRIGLNGVLAHIDRMYDSNPDFYEAEREVALALKDYAIRCRESLRGSGAPQALLDALEQVPENGARNLYEAFVACNFFFYIEGADSMGRVTTVLNDYSGEVEDIEGLFRELWQNIENCGAWHVLHDDRMPMTLPAVKAQKGLRRPNSGILVDEETSDAIWNAVFDNWEAGTVCPSLYSRKNYEAHVKEALHLTDEDAGRFCFGGCTELMVQGCSHVGSIEAGIHVLEILEQVGVEHDSFDSLMAAFWKAFDCQLQEMTNAAHRCRDFFAQCHPNPLRTLFYNDCLDVAKDFNSYGARYNASVINVVGLTNLVNSLYAIRLAYEGRLSVDVKELAKALKDDFPDEALRQELLALPKYGNGNESIDSEAASVINEIFARIRAKSTDKLPFLPSVILFTTFAYCGAFVGASADGRRGGTPVADSFGAMQGTDHEGPTSLLRSASTPLQHQALGTLILNIRLDKSMLMTPEARQTVKALILTYFHQGGLQLQATVADQATLEAALANPNDFPNLLVRIGGYSEYFNRLSRDLQIEVVKRTAHHL